MERLTKTELLAGHAVNYVDDEACFDVWSVPKKFMGAAIDRLAAYEDTGLEPDEVSKALTAMKSALWMGCELQAYRDSGLTTGELAHAAELLRADKEGRCKIPSCGETVFVLTDACWWTTNLKREEIIECRVTTHRLTKKGDVKFSVDGFWESGHPYKASFGATSIGKTVFLARAEAEAALGGGGDG